MLQQQRIFILSPYIEIYDLIIPSDNLLRQIKELVDFTFVYDELISKYSLDNGRIAIDPIRMFKYLLLKTIYNISDVDVVERSRYDMFFKYFLDMHPEDSVINPSSLTKFRKLRLSDMNLLDMLINKTVSIAIDKKLIRGKSIIVDSTHSKSRYNPMSPIEVLRERSKKLRKAVYSIDESMKSQFPSKNTISDLDQELDYSQALVNVIKNNESIANYPAIKTRLNYLEEAIVDDKKELSLSNDPDAKFGHKSADTSFFGYKTHIAMTEERIITAATVTTGEKNDGKELGILLEKSKESGVEIDTIIGDSAYSEKGNIELTTQEEISLVSKLNPSVTQGFRTKEEEFQFNKDAGMYICKAGHMAIRKAKQGKRGVSRNQTDTYFFDIKKCKLCGFRNGCYKENSNTKTYSVSIKSDVHKAQILFQQTEYFKLKSKERYKIEAKNGELKNRHGYDIALSSGIDCMRMQGALAIFTVNIKRIISLLGR